MSTFRTTGQGWLTGGSRTTDLAGNGAYVAMSIQDTRAMDKAQNGSGISDEGVAYTLDGTGAQGVAQPLRSNPYNNSDPGMEARMHVHVGSAVRRLTPIECSRLQGFPDDWLNGNEPPDSPKYAALGDAVTVPVISWIGARLAEADAVVVAAKEPE